MPRTARRTRAALTAITLTAALALSACGSVEDAAPIGGTATDPAQAGGPVSVTDARGVDVELAAPATDGEYGQMPLAA